MNARNKVIVRVPVVVDRRMVKRAQKNPGLLFPNQIERSLIRKFVAFQNKRNAFIVREIRAWLKVWGGQILEQHRETKLDSILHHDGSSESLVFAINLARKKWFDNQPDLVPDLERTATAISTTNKAQLLSFLSKAIGAEPNLPDTRKEIFAASIRS